MLGLFVEQQCCVSGTEGRKSSHVEPEAIIITWFLILMDAEQRRRSNSILKDGTGGCVDVGDGRARVER